MSGAYDLDRAHVFHSWSAQGALNPLVIERAEGSYVWDDTGKRYLDLSSQLVYTNIGHQHPKVVAAIQEQAATLCTVAPPFANLARGEAAELITQHAPDGFNKVFFTNGGADANEHAVRMARLKTGRFKVLAAYRSYHGGTQQAVNLTGDQRRWPNDTATNGVVHFFSPFLYRSTFHATTEAEECERALKHLEDVITFEGPATIAAIILETIPGTAGIMPPPPGYLAGVRELCDRFGIQWIADEVMCGFGRTGAWFGFDHYGAVPDLITFAKGVNSGYVPLGGVIISDPIAQEFDERVYPGGLTYSGHPLACAAAKATIQVMRDEKIVENASRLGTEVFAPGFAELAERHESIGDVRGLGVFWVLELVADKATREPLATYPGTSPQMTALNAACREQGLLPITVVNRVHVVPPCTITDVEAKEAIAALDSALSSVDL